MMECYSTTPVTLEQYLINLDAAVDNVAAENDALRAENAALKAQQDSTPREDLLAAVLLGMVWAAQSADDAAGGLAACERALKWLKAPAPKETTDA